MADTIGSSDQGLVPHKTGRVGEVEIEPVVVVTARDGTMVILESLAID